MLANAYRYFLLEPFLSALYPGWQQPNGHLPSTQEMVSCVGPDNGLFSYVLQDRWSGVVELTNPAYRLSTVSPYLHGRDNKSLLPCRPSGSSPARPIWTIGSRA